jgi:hypothetical protein
MEYEIQARKAWMDGRYATVYLEVLVAPEEHYRCVAKEQAFIAFWGTTSHIHHPSAF